MAIVYVSLFVTISCRHVHIRGKHKKLMESKANVRGKVGVESDMGENKEDSEVVLFGLPPLGNKFEDVEQGEGSAQEGSGVDFTFEGVVGGLGGKGKKREGPQKRKKKKKTKEGPPPPPPPSPPNSHPLGFLFFWES
jgi:hypothetical protein